MESVIRDGTLRLLTAESTCDVILSCQGRRLMAHKVILSVASPVFRDLLTEDSTDPTVVILPDISSHTMSLILDYIYTGSVIVYSSTLQNFLSLANLLKIQLDFDMHLKQVNSTEENYLHKNNIEKTEQRKTIKKLPQLIPINKLRYLEKPKQVRSTNSCVLSSPWRSRVETIYGDPRDDILDNNTSKLYENDSNNNFQPPFFSSYQQNRNAFIKPRDQGQFLLNLNKSNNGILNTTISRPPEDVAIDRDKPKIKSNIKNWMTNNFEDLQKSDTEEFNNLIQENECKYSSIVKNEEKCVNSEIEQNNDKEKPFKCEECGKCFSQLRNFKYHRSVHEGTKEFAAKCLECGKTFNDKGYLSSHMKIHRDKKEYACPHCPKRFNQRVAYNMHLRIHTGIKPHECPTCKKSFSRKMLLKQHQRVHTGERPYSCPECGKTFADRSNMSLHARLHTGVKPYACNVCPKSFTKKHHLKTHMNFHTGLKPYTCDKCGLAFSQSSNMRTHYKKCLLKRELSENEMVPEEEEDNKSS